MYESSVRWWWCSFDKERENVLDNERSGHPSVIIDDLLCHIEINSWNMISVSHFMKYVTIFHSFIVPLSMKLLPFISITNKFVRGLFHVFLIMNTNNVYRYCMSFELLFNGLRWIPNTHHNRGWNLGFLCYKREKTSINAVASPLFTIQTTKIQAAGLNSEGYCHSLLGPERSIPCPLQPQ